MRRARLPLTLLLALTVLSLPGCLLGAPLAAVSGEPYGMTIDDVKALQGKKGRIWSKAPVFAAIDLPFAFALDTGLLPIALITWGIAAIAGGGEDHDEGGSHTHGGERHTHDGGQGRHSHDDE